MGGGERGTEGIRYVGGCSNKLCVYKDILWEHIQWKPSITDTFGEQCFGLHTEVAFVERLFCTRTVHLGPGCLAAAGLYSEVVVNRGSTVLPAVTSTQEADVTCIYNVLWSICACVCTCRL